MIDRISSFGPLLQRDYLVHAMQSRMNQLTNEIASGRKADPVGKLGSNAPVLYQLHAQADQQTALQTSVTLALQRLETTQSALGDIGSAAQDIATQAIHFATGDDAGKAVLAGQARNAMAEVISRLNTQQDGSALFAGDAGSVAPMQAADAAGGPLATVNAVLAAAVSAKGGPLSQSDIAGLIDGADGISSVFDDTNSDPARRYTGAFYTAPDDGKPTKVLIGATETLQYDTKANAPAFRDLMKGLSMLSMLDAPPGQLDDSARKELLTQANAVIGKAQGQLTTQQGLLGVTQARLQRIADGQQAAADATQNRILGFEQADIATDATALTALQTQLQASFEITAQISQLTLTHFLPNSF